MCIYIMCTYSALHLDTSVYITYIYLRNCFVVVHVQKTESNATQVTLEDLELDAAGEYSCEVSADAPSFHTAIVYATMNIAGEYICI